MTVNRIRKKKEKNDCEKRVSDGPSNRITEGRIFAGLKAVEKGHWNGKGEDGEFGKGRREKLREVGIYGGLRTGKGRNSYGSKGKEEIWGLVVRKLWGMSVKSLQLGYWMAGTRLNAFVSIKRKENVEVSNLATNLPAGFKKCTLSIAELGNG
jgi:hypothetical protein